MTSPYPIIIERSLGRTERGGRFGLGRHRRPEGEVPQVKGEQVRVFRVDGKHVVDHGRRGDDDEQVVRASHVAVVDMSHNVEVRCELKIPSADAEEFTISVTFRCTVTDAIAVVRDGQGDAARILLGYVRSHQRLFQLGVDHEISAVNLVRPLVQTQIEAYVQVKPPVLSGISAELASVEVLTPDEVRALQRRLNEQKAAHKIEAERVRLEHELQRLQARHTKEIEESTRLLELERKKHDTQLQEMRLVMEQQEQHLRQQIAAAGNAFAAEETQRLHGAYGNDPIKAAIFAEQQGRLSGADIPTRMQEQADREEAAGIAERDRAWKIEDDDRNWTRQRTEREYEVLQNERERLYLVEQEKRTRQYAVEDKERELEQQRLELEHQALQIERDRRFQIEQEKRDREYALEDARQALELKKLERLYAVQDGDRDLQREMIERHYASEQRELERLHTLKDKELEIEREDVQRRFDAEQAKLRHEYEVQVAERERRDAIEDRDHQRAVDQEIRDRQDRLHLLQVRLEMLKEIAKHGHVDQVPINPEDVIRGIAAETTAGSVTGTTKAKPVAADRAALPAEHAELEAGLDDDDPDDDESAFREEGLDDR